eukprot:3878234-Prymnesium_polylepis.1
MDVPGTPAIPKEQGAACCGGGQRARAPHEHRRSLGFTQCITAHHPQPHRAGAKCQGQKEEAGTLCVVFVVGRHRRHGRVVKRGRRRSDAFTALAGLAKAFGPDSSAGCT